MSDTIHSFIRSFTQSGPNSKSMSCILCPYHFPSIIPLSLDSLSFSSSLSISLLYFSLYLTFCSPFHPLSSGQTVVRSSYATSPSARFLFRVCLCIGTEPLPLSRISLYVFPTSLSRISLSFFPTSLPFSLSLVKMSLLMTRVIMR